MESNQSLNLAPFQVVLNNIDIKNIAKIITTSKTVKITKRDEKSKNTSPSKLSSDTSSKLTPIEESDGMVDMLAKIYGFMKQSNTDKIKRLEKENNFKEEQDFELLKKHEELIKAIKKLRQSPTATSVNNSSDFVAGEPGPIDPWTEFNQPDTPDRPKSNRAPKKLPKGTPPGSWMRGAAARAGGVAAVLAIPFMAAGYQMEKTEKNPNDPEIKDTPYAKFIRGESTTQGKAGNQNRRSSLKEVRASEIKTALEAKPAFGDTELIEMYGMDRSGLTNFVEKNPNGVLRPEQTNNTKSVPATENQKTNTTPTPAETPKKSGSPTNKETKAPTESPVNIPSKSVVPIEKTLDKNEEIVGEKENASVILNRVTKTNIESKLESKLSSSDVNIVNNQIVNSSSQSVSMGKGALPAVRNLESTYQKMIYDSTRIV